MRIVDGVRIEHQVVITNNAAAIVTAARSSSAKSDDLATIGAAQAIRTALQQNAKTLAGIGSASTNSGLGVANARLGASALQQQT